MKFYDYTLIEAKWQEVWVERQSFRAQNPGDRDFDPQQPKYYVLDMFPYPSGSGLHVGHPLGYIATDIISRYKRMRGFNVLHPMGYDSFGLPAEQYAIETGTHPRITTEKNIETYRRQLKSLGISFDWSRELATTDPEYYRWTQWIFLQLFESWYDVRADKARPMAELITDLESDSVRSSDGILYSPSDSEFAGLPAWSTLNNTLKHELLGQHRLAFLAEVPVNWCPQLGTVLANEEVTPEGRSERGNFPVFRRPLKQWMLRITSFADRLLDDLEDLDWSDSLKTMQKHWIGKSHGAQVRFQTESGQEIEVFTTRPDTLFGATYMVLAPEHTLVDEITAPEHQKAVKAYRKAAAKKSELDRQTDTKKKTGVFTGGFAINPVNNRRIPIWIADYVLMGYGTGAIMAVPGHDQRDFEFAKAFDLPIVPVVTPPSSWFQEQQVPEADQERYPTNPGALEQAYSGEGVSINSENDGLSLNGLDTPEAKATIIAWLDQHSLGQKKTQYKLRDWLFSRQRYWGEPIPVLHGPEGELVGLSPGELPLELPPLEDFKPQAMDDPNAPPQPSLGKADESWKSVVRDGVSYTRELNTMPQWAGSCWYYLRYLDTKNSQRFVGEEKERYWMGPEGIDLYVGGVEHAVLHLLYARFWHKVLFDLGQVSTPEPFKRLFNQGYIQAFAYQDSRGMYVSAEEVTQKDDGTFWHGGEQVTRTMGKMGKSLKNSVTPDEVIETYGCDTFRLYEMYLGPIDQSKIWNTDAIVGVHRFLGRLWRNLVNEETGELQVDESSPQGELARHLHQTIKDVTEDMESFSFNTATARVIELNNALVGKDTIPREVAEALILMLAPQAPHICEELWERLGHPESLAKEPWPTWDESALTQTEIDVVVQVMGKKRALISVPVDADQKTVEALALEDPSVKRHTEGKTVRKIIYVPGKLVNIVAN